MGEVMFETYRQLGKQREAELLRTAEHSRRHPPTGTRLTAVLVLVALLGLAVVVTAATAAQPSTSANDRAHNRALSATLAPAAPSPEDLSFNRVAPVAPAPAILAPDDRPFTRSMVVEPRTAPAAIVTAPQGFDWGDAAIGSAFGLTIGLLGVGMVLTARRRTLSPA
jgi:hypothetical protein